MPRCLQLSLLSLVVLVTIFIGAGAAAGAYQPDLMVKLASEGDGSYVGSGVFEASASLQTKSQAAFEGIPARYRVLLRNAGDQADSFLLKGTASGPGFTIRYLDAGGVDRTDAFSGPGYPTVILAPGEEALFLVQVTLTAITPGASYRVTVSAASASRSAQFDQVKTDTVACGTSAAVTVSAPPDGAGQPGSVISYPYTVTNVGSAVNTFALSAATGNGWRGALLADNGAATATTGPLAPGATYRFQLAVTVPAESVNGDRAETVLAVTGNGTSGADAVTTTSLAATISVSENVRNLTQGGPFEPVATAFPGDILEYRMSVTNSGSAPATGVSIDTPVPADSACVAGSLWIGTTSGGDGAHCPAAECGSVRESAGTILARLGQGATDATGGTVSPGKTFYVYFRVQVE